MDAVFQNNAALSMMVVIITASSLLFFVFLVLPLSQHNQKIRLEVIGIYSLFLSQVIACIFMFHIPQWLYLQLSAVFLLSICFQFELVLSTVTKKPIATYYQQPIFYFYMLSLCAAIAAASLLLKYAMEISIFLIAASGVVIVQRAIGLLRKPDKSTPRGYQGIRVLFHGICIVMLLAPVLLYFAKDPVNDQIITLIIIGFFSHITYGVTALIILSENIKLSYRESVTDSMTGIYNRRHFTAQSKKTLSQSGAMPVALVIADIDFFKRINDNYGHDIGDQVICLFAGALKNYFKDASLVARLGGEEFVVLLKNTTADKALSKVEYFRHTILPSSFRLENFQVELSASFGLSDSHSIANSDLGELMKKADLALYEAKNSGRNCSKIYDQQHSVSLFYQPAHSNQSNQA